MAELMVLVSFSGVGSGSNGGGPLGSLITDAQGNLYGTTQLGGANGAGTVFEIRRTGTDMNGAPSYDGSPTTLVSFEGDFKGSQGGNPYGSLYADTQGNLYGTTRYGGAAQDGTVNRQVGANGTVFEIVRMGSDASGAPSYAGSPTVLFSFDAGFGARVNGGQPTGSLIADGQGNLYGTASGNGAGFDGTVFQLARTNPGVSGAPTYATSPTVLASFAGPNGGDPAGSLTADAAGNLYGTTSGGGASGDGTVFEIARTNPGADVAPTYATSVTTLVSFSGGNGESPAGSLIADAAGNLYGTTSGGGANGNATGTVFEIARTNPGAAGTPTYASTPTTLATFNGRSSGTNGGQPQGSLIADARGNLYGTTLFGGANGAGTVFEVARIGNDANGSPVFAATPTTLVSFTGTGSGTSGGGPQASLIADALGNLYGTTKSGGANGAGTVFEITDSGFVVCFVAGTEIRTWRDAAEVDLAVEALRIGDLVVTASGAHRPIRWLGHRVTRCHHHPRPDEVMPVRIAAHAFGENRPARDLRVSPGHAICVDLLGEVLIPASSLINGATILQEEVDSVTYWHVELDSHDVILAENLPCESYLEMGNRGFFAEGEVVALDASPDAREVTHADFCRPFHADGVVVTFARERLAARALQLGWRLEDVSLDDDLRLEVDGVPIAPIVRGLSARFLVPAGAKSVWLVNGTAVPAHVGHSADTRALGVCLGALTIDDGFCGPRTIAADDPRLCVGFHAIEPGPQRWTAGRARLPADLWEGVDIAFFLRVDTTRPALPRWRAPARAYSVSMRAAPSSDVLRIPVGKRGERK